MNGDVLFVVIDLEGFFITQTREALGSICNVGKLLNTALGLAAHAGFTR
jgi:hypothetical protein